MPAFVGLGAPHWDPHAGGMLIGLRRDTTPGHIARAALESIAFQVADVLEAVQSETTPLAALRVDGGAAVNNLLMQFQADLLGVPVVRPQVTETTALGAAYLAGLATGFWASPEELRAKRQGDVRFEPKMDARNEPSGADAGSGPWNGRRAGRSTAEAVCDSARTNGYSAPTFLAKNAWIGLAGGEIPGIMKIRQAVGEVCLRSPRPRESSKSGVKSWHRYATSAGRVRSTATTSLTPTTSHDAAGA